MGYETKCAVRVKDASGVRHADAATVLLETDELIVRGEARVRVPRTSITQVTSRGGIVTVTSPGATVSLTLGADSASKWKARIEAPPKRVIDKLDVKPGAKVWLAKVADPDLIAQLNERAGSVSSARSASGCDIVFVQVDRDDDLDRIDRAAAAINETGAIWVVHPKGTGGVKDTTIYARADALGLAYVKVARISDTLTGEKLVKPRAMRRKPS